MANHGTHVGLLRLWNTLQENVKITMHWLYFHSFFQSPFSPVTFAQGHLSELYVYNSEWKVSTDNN